MVALLFWIKETPFLFCAGNHVFIDPTPLMRKGGINAINITNKLYNFDGVKFYGFPYVPYYGYWSNELFHDQMSDELDKVAALCNEGAIDVLVAHCPIAGILDLDHRQNLRFGNPALADFFNYKVYKYPKALLVGHVHSDNGTATLNNMFISNAALTQRIIEI
jgi:Icc-related predicted phosphoesterase